MICCRSKLWGQFRNSPRGAGAQLESSCCPWHWFLEPFETQFSFIYPFLFWYIIWSFHVFCILIILVSSESSCFSWKEYVCFSPLWPRCTSVLWSFKVQCCRRTARCSKRRDGCRRLISRQGQQSIMIGMFVMNQLGNSGSCHLFPLLGCVSAIFVFLSRRTEHKVSTSDKWRMFLKCFRLRREDVWMVCWKGHMCKGKTHLKHPRIHHLGVGPIHATLKKLNLSHSGYGRKAGSPGWIGKRPDSGQRQTLMLKHQLVELHSFYMCGIWLRLRLFVVSLCLYVCSRIWGCCWNCWTCC